MYRRTTIHKFNCTPVYLINHIAKIEFAKSDIYIGSQTAPLS